MHAYQLLNLGVHQVYREVFGSSVDVARDALITLGQDPAEAQRLAAEDGLSSGIGRLLATAEAYPELKASASYLELQRRISGLEEQITHRREFYKEKEARWDVFPAHSDIREART